MVKGENQLDDNVAWYGTIIDIVELRYTKQNRVVLFNCNWFDTATKGSGYKVDRYGILSVNTRAKLKTQEPFVLADQVTQAYYIQEIKNSTWSVVVETKPRNVYEMPTNEGESFQEEEAHHGYTHDNQNEDEDLE
ncbi:hypothetical protein M0R45_025820 [Rubus argutus]|uniref:DUF4216 domain-containing protein n=1 Tax=Rubus argutus TaxID=59490 RepID=A0AAW1WZ39_RUBAR